MGSNSFRWEHCKRIHIVLSRTVRNVLWLLGILMVLSACRGKNPPPPVRRTLPKEILLPPTRTIESAPGLPKRRRVTPSVPAATPTPVLTPTPTPTPVPSMQRTRPAALPPQRIVVPAIELDAPVVPMRWHNVVRNGQEFTEWDIPDYAAGFQIGSALPGQPGNTVIAGHHNIKGRVFDRLWNLVPGDSIYLYTAENVFHYVVEDMFFLRELGASPEQRRQNAVWIGPSLDERLTLVTCWPPTGNAYRLIVIAKPAQLVAAQHAAPGR